MRIRTRCVQWMQKALDQMNVQVHRALADITGVTGMAIVRDIVKGERDRAKPAKEKAIKNRGEQASRTALWRFSGVDLTRIDGISAGAAQVILTEVGFDL